MLWLKHIMYRIILVKHYSKQINQDLLIFKVNYPYLDNTTLFCFIQGRNIIRWFLSILRSDLSSISPENHILHKFWNLISIVKSLGYHFLYISVTFWYKGRPTPEKVTYPLSASQKVAMSRNIEKMIAQALNNTDEVPEFMQNMVLGRYTWKIWPQNG